MKNVVLYYQNGHFYRSTDGAQTFRRCGWIRSTAYRLRLWWHSVILL